MRMLMWQIGIGVLWSGDHLFPGTVETLELLRSKGMEYSSHRSETGNALEEKEI